MIFHILLLEQMSKMVGLYMSNSMKFTCMAYKIIFTYRPRQIKTRQGQITLLRRFVDLSTIEQPRASLPKTLFLQIDKFSRQNKNNYLLAYWGGLDAWTVFDEIIVGFLPVGHSYEDIAQAFILTSNALHPTVANAFKDFHEVIFKVYNCQTTADHIL